MVNETIDPAIQRIILKIVAFLNCQTRLKYQIQYHRLSPSQDFITWTLARVHKENALQKGANRQERERQLQNLVKRSSHP